MTDTGHEPTADAPADVPEPESDQATTAGAVRRILPAAVVGVLALALLATAVVFGVRWIGDLNRDSLRDEVLQAGRQAAVNLTTIHHESAEADVARLMDSSTGDFGAQFGQNQQAFVDIVKQAKVDTTGEVVDAAIDRADDRSASVLVAIRSQVTNAATAEPQQRDYRMAVDLELAPDGRWMSSGVEFVP
ncbi:hypothetical protein Ae168Ps1_1846c [Pseudonocardia sp. Ae168_Ps1]|uniref:hypothetical protein n=1 Tax=unclassified Pseudonocardia TaxID=2619320 RepID=UPI0009678E51|nr:MULTISPECIES: hypothetical protein [unclassified Pseudonocardia]OLL73464.1 hypothetical protein Ae150APs1_1842c [Pseudonocardia sp. Ae150A_Ps1]OLL79440.1 hypothetical protein Ae168Ps1_1846c [Pseudonocardia sp. Ae168_Ps1]OLL86425.1 hypothetical protein Ae263Ps1_3480 [Pseudonocardia sp. Ae263_Ps1]OLL93534.1 hypothetical protein Ae356Ps1_3431c [Pseudonocardia sp. Ae356_Ps1]